MSEALRSLEDVNSDNPIGADNQQGTRLSTLDPGWVVGFTDGEGCFSVSIHSNALARPTRGWHIQPTFQVSQHEDHHRILLELERFFHCGKIRRKGPSSSVEVYVVHSTKLLLERIIPFFEGRPLRVKRDDFEKFADIVRSIRSQDHHRPEEFERIVRLAYSMNARGKQRKRPIEAVLLGSSETAREASSLDRR